MYTCRSHTHTNTHTHMYIVCCMRRHVYKMYMYIHVYTMGVPLVDHFLVERERERESLLDVVSIIIMQD